MTMYIILKDDGDSVNDLGLSTTNKVLFSDKNEANKIAKELSSKSKFDQDYYVYEIELDENKCTIYNAGNEYN